MEMMISTHCPVSFFQEARAMEEDQAMRDKELASGTTRASSNEIDNERGSAQHRSSAPQHKATVGY